MADDPQNPAGDPKPADATPPAGDQKPEGDGTPSEPSTGGSADVEALTKVRDEYEKNKPLLEAYGQFEKVLEGDEEIAKAIEAAIKGVADKRKGAPAAGAGVETPPSGVVANPDQVTAVELRNEIRFRDYTSEFVRVAQAAGVTDAIAQEAFDGTVAELLKLNRDPLANFDVTLVEKAFKNWNDRVERIVKAKNDIYAKTKQQDSVPAQGGGSAPKEQPQELYSPDDRRAFIEQGLRAANTMH